MIILRSGILNCSPQQARVHCSGPSNTAMYSSIARLDGKAAARRCRSVAMAGSIPRFVNQPLQHLARAIGQVAGQPRWMRAPRLSHEAPGRRQQPSPRFFDKIGHNPPPRGSSREGPRAGGASFLNERPVWSAASSNANGEDGREVARRREVAVSGTSAFWTALRQSGRCSWHAGRSVIRSDLSVVRNRGF